MRVRRPLLFVTWGLVLLIGYGAMWLSVRGQHPFHGPAWQTLLLSFLLLLIALVVTAQIVDWAASGVGGRSEVQRGIFALAVVAGYAALLIEKTAMASAGASRPVQAVLGATAPMLAAGLVFVATFRSRRPAELGPARSGPLAARRGGRRRVGRPGDHLRGLRAGRRRWRPADGRHRAPAAPVMSEAELDQAIHVPARLRIMVTLASLPDGDDLSFTRLQDLIGLTPGNLITHLRKLEDTGYITTQRNGSGVTARTAVALTSGGRAALDRYSTVLRELLDSASPR